MQFTEAFERLGYSVEAQRQDWSAENEHGVCISLWRQEMGIRDGLLWIRPLTDTSMPLTACWATTRPSPLKQVTRCHSVSFAVKPLSSL